MGRWWTWAQLCSEFHAFILFFFLPHSMTQLIYVRENRFDCDPCNLIWSKVVSVLEMLFLSSFFFGCFMDDNKLFYLNSGFITHSLSCSCFDAIFTSSPLVQRHCDIQSTIFILILIYGNTLWVIVWVLNFAETLNPCLSVEWKSLVDNKLGFQMNSTQLIGDFSLQIIPLYREAEREKMFNNLRYFFGFKRKKLFSFLSASENHNKDFMLLEQSQIAIQELNLFKGEICDLHFLIIYFSVKSFDFSFIYF